jgi:uncharacterized LabA/DUF88 family protein
MTKKLQERTNCFPNAADVELEINRIRRLNEVSDYELLRIYWYDAQPASDSVKRPVSGDKYDLAATDRFRNAQRLYDQLILKPYFALRLGEVVVSPQKWRMKPRTVRELMKTPRELTDQDFDLDASQKGVDMRVGMDMARLALRDLVRAIVVVTADSDFIPAFKFVRREGLVVILDTMQHNVRVQLRQHSDIVIG